MKKILLLGDSIRQGYCGHVREIMKNEAEILFPEENGRFAQYTLRQLQDWKGHFNLSGDDVDLVHWNNGLWDVGHLGNGLTGEATSEKAEAATGHYTYEEESLTPPDIYGYMIRRVYQRIHTLFPRAVVVFALSTPVLEDQVPAFLCRKNVEIREYNDIAMHVLSEYDIKFNDLYAFTEQNTQHLHSDWVHYSEEGSRVIAEEVASVIRKHLS